MIVKTEAKSKVKKLSFNTRIELITRMLIVSIGIVLVIIAYFIGSGSYMAEKYIYEVTGLISHDEYHDNFVLYGLLAFGIALIVSISFVWPFLIVKKTSSVKKMIIVALVFLTAYVIAGISIAASFLSSNYYKSDLLITSIIILVFGYLIIVVCLVFLWRETIKQWKMQKTAEYLSDVQQIENTKEALERLTETREDLILSGVKAEKLSKEEINLINYTKENVLHIIKKRKKK